MINHNSCLSK